MFKNISINHKIIAFAISLAAMTGYAGDTPLSSFASSFESKASVIQEDVAPTRTEQLINASKIAKESIRKGISTLGKGMSTLNSYRNDYKMSSDQRKAFTTKHAQNISAFIQAIPYIGEQHTANLIGHTCGAIEGAASYVGLPEALRGLPTAALLTDASAKVFTMTYIGAAAGITVAHPFVAAMAVCAAGTAVFQYMAS